MYNLRKVSTNNNEKLIATTVRLEESVYNKFKDLAKKSGSTLGEIIRHTLEFSLGKYLKRVGYSDDEKTAGLLAAVRELCRICNNIYNEVHRIGINYNQELRLKNAEKKYTEAINSKLVTDAEKFALMQERSKYKDEIRENSFTKKEFKKILERFEAAAEEARLLGWRIQHAD